MLRVLIGTVALAVAADEVCPTTLMQNIDCIGDDLVPPEPADSVEECCARCATTVDCGAFTLKRESSYGGHVSYAALLSPYQRNCYLKRQCRVAALPELFPEFLPDYSPNSSVRVALDNASAFWVWAVSGVFPTAMQAPRCAVPFQGVGYQCLDTSLGVVGVTDEGACCDLCREEAECQLYSYNITAQSCELKSTCEHKVASSHFSTGWTPPAEPVAYEHKVGEGMFTVPGYECGDMDGRTMVVYPDGVGPFKVVAFAHGSGGYLDHGPYRIVRGNEGLDEWLKTIASIGFIVVAPFTGPGNFSCPREYIDVLHALSIVKEQGAALHPIFGKADWSATGAIGHSMGASNAPRVAVHGSDYGLNVTAVVASHGGASTSKLQVPTLFTSGTLDSKDVGDNGTMPHAYYEHEFEICSSQKVFVNLRGGFHMEPLEGKRLNYLAAQFLGCHLLGRSDFCEYITNDLCARQDLETCVVDMAPGTRRRRTSISSTAVSTTAGMEVMAPAPSETSVASSRGSSLPMSV